LSERSCLLKGRGERASGVGMCATAACWPLPQSL
jgi:hypothetical protein